jgi:hypothetical protein
METSNCGAGSGIRPGGGTSVSGLYGPGRMISVNNRIRGTTKKKNFNHKGAEGARRINFFDFVFPLCSLIDRESGLLFRAFVVNS